MTAAIVKILKQSEVRISAVESFIFFSPIVAGLRRPFDLDVIPRLGADRARGLFRVGFILVCGLRYNVIAVYLADRRFTDNQGPNAAFCFVYVSRHDFLRLSE